MKKLILYAVLPALLLATACAPEKTPKEKYLEFLYSTMPLPDSLVYPQSWWEANVDKTIEVRQKMNWGVPEREFVHFVLPLRVNNEGLDDFRTVYADSLCARVSGMTMEEAVLEINHWCHERVTYQPSDGRTSAPMSTIRYGFGRCGEESVVTVAALRAAGIPARQVYTPRWAHTDDNHAWVEAWVDGKWHFLGACEPEPALDMGWFNSPVSRAMLLHTNVYGDYQGPEGVIRKNDLYTEINLISNYVPSRVNTVTITDAEGKPVEGATVEFKIYNYAEFYTVARYTTGADGKASLLTGLGDIMVWAYKDGKFGLAKSGSENTEVALTHTFGESVSMDFHIVPPVDNPLPSNATEEQIAANALRLKQEDSIRAALHPGVVNQETLDAFREYCKASPELAKAGEIVLKNITPKDLRDIPYDVLVDAVSDISNQDRNVLSPRIELEKQIPFHKEIREGLQGTVTNYQEALSWVKENIRIVENRNPMKLRIPPVAVWRGRVCDKNSLGIFYVALCRSIGVPARISWHNGNVQVQSEGQWLDVNLEEEVAKANPRGYLNLDFSDTGLDAASAYFGRFTLSKIEDGVCHLMDYEYSEDQPTGKIPLEEGYYMAVTGTRLADGSVLSHVQTFNVEADRTVSQKLVIWPAEGKGEKAGEGSYIVARFAENGEPTTHALRQMESAAETLNAWGGKIILYGPTESSLGFYKGFISNLKNVSYEVDADNSVLKEIEEKCKGDAKYLPFVVLKDKTGKALYFSQGYNTSLEVGLSQTVK